MRQRINNKSQKVAKLMMQQKCKCYYCNCKFEERGNNKNPTLEHLQPYCKVWNDTEFVLACRKCNLLKWDISEELFRDWYICVNIKPKYNWQSYNKAIKVRNPIKWYEKLFPKLFWWNRKRYKLTIKLYE